MWPPGKPSPSAAATATSCTTLVFSPDGRRLIASGTSPKDVVKLWDVETGRDLATLPGEPGWYARIGFSPDGNTLFAASLEGTALLWRAPSWEEIEAAENRRQASMNASQKATKVTKKASARVDRLLFRSPSLPSFPSVKSVSVLLFRLHAHRVARGHRHHRRAGLPAFARALQGQGQGAVGFLPEQPQATSTRLAVLHGRPQRPLAAESDGPEWSQPGLVESAGFVGGGQCTIGHDHHERRARHLVPATSAPSTFTAARPTAPESTPGRNSPARAATCLAELWLATIPTRTRRSLPCSARPIPKSTALRPRRCGRFWTAARRRSWAGPAGLAHRPNRSEPRVDASAVGPAQPRRQPVLRGRTRGLQTMALAEAVGDNLARASRRQTLWTWKTCAGCRPGCRNRSPRRVRSRTTGRRRNAGLQPADFRNLGLGPCGKSCSV